MKQYGRQKQHPGNLPDNHPPKGYVNWWEYEYHNGKSKKRARVRDYVRDYEQADEKTSGS
jgi:hypothetical protein